MTELESDAPDAMPIAIAVDGVSTSADEGRHPEREDTKTVERVGEPERPSPRLHPVLGMSSPGMVHSVRLKGESMPGWLAGLLLNGEFAPFRGEDAEVCRRMLAGE